MLTTATIAKLQHSKATALDISSQTPNLNLHSRQAPPRTQDRFRNCTFLLLLQYGSIAAFHCNIFLCRLEKQMSKAIK